MIALTLVAMSPSAKRENLGYAEGFHVKVTQMFRSSKDERVMSETEIGELTPITSISITGYKVR